MTSRRVCWAFACLSFSYAWAQVERGVVLGSVTDSSGAGVPSARVAILNLGTNVETRAGADARGYYISGPLWPGRYRITIQAPGFKTWTREFDLDVNQRAQVDASLSVGELTETVSVTGEAPLLETQTAAMGNVRTEAAIRNLPLNGRNFIQLVWLAPGAQPGTTSNLTNGARGNQSATVNGARGSNNSFLIDGIYNKENSVNGNVLLPSPDAIEEFKVQTSMMDAQFGQSGGGVINVAIRRGSNQVHGSLFEFLRNSDLDAKNAFDRADRPIPPFKLNQFGGTVGGPVVLPKIYNGRNRTFFFVDYQGWRQRKAVTNLTTVPSEPMRAGDFSAFPSQVFDPATIHVDPTDPAGQRLVRDPFPANRIPLDRINPVSRKLVQLYPLPIFSSPTNNIITNPSAPFTVDQFDARMDHRAGDRDSIFVRYSWQFIQRVSPPYFPAPALGAGPGFPTDANDRAQQTAIGWTHTFSARTINEARVGYSRLASFSNPFTTGTNLASQFGIPGVNVNPIVSAMTSIFISQFAGIGEGSFIPLVKVNNNFQYSEAVSLTRGIHTLRIGTDIVRRQINTFDAPNPLGSFSFNGQFSNRGIGVSTGGTGSAMADFLLGAPASETYTSLSGLTGDRRVEWGSFVQDDIRVTSRLTLNLGLRYDLATPNVEVADRMANFVPALGDIFVAGSPQVHGSRATVVTDKNNWAPRVGFAYHPLARTVIRGGYGIFYSTEDVGGDPRLAANPPFVGNPQFNADFSDFNNARKISDGLPARPATVPSKGPGIHNPIRYRPYDNRTPYVQQWNFNVQRELPSDMLASVAYVGSKGTKLVTFFDLNQARPAPGQVDTRRPFPDFGGYANDVGDNGSSVYHSLQFLLEKRFSHGLAFQSSYVWSHSIDSSSQPTGNTGVQNTNNIRAERGNSDFDMRHRFVTSWSYELPFGKGKSLLGNAGRLTQLLAGGWQFNGIQSVSSGLPFTPVVAGNLNTLNGTGTQRPDRIGSGLLPDSDRNPSHWFDSSAFRVPAPFTFGNSGRNILIGPRLVNFDVSLFKNFIFSEDARRSLQFRTEVFNALNTPQFNNPNATIGDPGVGRITSAGASNTFVGANRQIQFALKLYF